MTTSPHAFWCASLQAGTNAACNCKDAAGQPLAVAPCGDAFPVATPLTLPARLRAASTTIDIKLLLEEAADVIERLESERDRVRAEARTLRNYLVTWRGDPHDPD